MGLVVGLGACAAEMRQRETVRRRVGCSAVKEVRRQGNACKAYA